VVLEEFWRSKDSPDHEIAERLFALAFTTHPYHRPIIGYEETVRSISRDDMLRIFRTWYAPNNMIFVAVGDFDSAAMLRAVEERFGVIPALTLPPRPRTPEPQQGAPRVLTFPFQAELARVEIALPSVAATDARVPALDVLSDLLGAGYNSTLYTALKRRRDLAHDVYAFNYTPGDPGIFLLGATCMADDVPEVVRHLMQPVREPALAFSEQDLAGAKTRLISHFVHARETYQGIANQLGRSAFVYGDPNYGARYIAAVETLTRDDLQQAADTFFTPQRANIALLMPTDVPLPDTTTVLDWAQGEDKRHRFHTSPVATDTPVMALPDGGTWIVQTDRKAPLVAIRTLFAGGQRAEPQGKEGLVRLLTSVWDRGTTLRSAAEIERELDRLGAALQASSDRDSLQLGARFLKETFAEGLDLYFEILTEPTFPEADVVREQVDQLRDIDTLKEQRFQFAMQHFLEAFYGAHPYNHLAIGTRAGLTAVTRDDLMTLHERLVRPEQAVHVVVGDITAEEVLALWERHSPEALAASDAAPAVAVPALPVWSEMVTRVVEMEGQQTHIIWGFPTVTGRHPDRHALHVLDAILGGSGGRLFTELRDQKSLAYAVTSFDTYPVDPGFLALYIGCSPDKELEALSEFERVLHEVHSAGVTSTELERAQTYLAGALDISLQSTSQRTAVYGLGMLHQGTWQAYQEYLDAVRKVTVAEVQRVAQTYLQAPRSLRMILRGKR
jgi:zinc protease